MENEIGVRALVGVVAFFFFLFFHLLYCLVFVYFIRPKKGFCLLLTFSIKLVALLLDSFKRRDRKQRTLR